MIVYADRKTKHRTRDMLRCMRSLRGIDRLIAFGEFESGVLDALNPREDHYDATVRALRFASVAVAREWLGQGRAALGPLDMLALPDTIETSTPEGYAWYALYPQMYADAARRFRKFHGPGRTVVLGIRSIGTSLSSVVAAVVEAAMSVTVRPRGHPFDRSIAWDGELAWRLRQQDGAHFLIVDEGPGISGSSFAAVARALGDIGVPDEHIVFLPAWDADGSTFRSDAARAQWQRHQRFTSAFEDSVLGSGALGAPEELRDLGAGRWRELLYGAEEQWPAVHGQHERRKYLRGDELLKFAGLGRYGMAALERARTLAEAGFAPEALRLEEGFLVTRWVEGKPATPGAAPAGLVRRIAEYLAWIRRRFATSEPVRYDELVAMMRTNIGEEFGFAWQPAFDRPLIEAVPAAAVDGRMLAHEWLATPDGWRKCDGVDHHCDHFFPGTQDVAWDIAGAIVELGIPREALLSEYLALGADPTLTRRMPFYMRAYLAYRLGYARLAAQTAGEPAEAERFVQLADRYASLLRMLLA